MYLIQAAIELNSAVVATPNNPINFSNSKLKKEKGDILERARK
jgi:hypothetical protein